MSNVILAVSVVVAWIVCQLIKAMLGNKRSWRFVFLSGGMPSSHTAVAAALATGLYFLQGFSALFVTALVIAALVIQEALDTKRHTPAEVSVGLLIGAVTAVILFLL